MSEHHQHPSHDHAGHDPAAQSPSAHSHGTHGHGAHGHGSHSPHEPSSAARAAHDRAFEAAVPDPGRTVVPVALEAGEFDWSFTPGSVLRAWGYNGQVPGPTIEARVGDVLEVRLTNLLPEPTTIHWHGLRIPAAMDGTDSVQWPIAAGESFTYRFRLPDAGTFWYHPHSNETVQMERGLYGALIVRGPDEPVLDTERVLVLDDLKLDSKGEMAGFGGVKEEYDGRIGNIRLVNGRAEPELAMAGGNVERWRVVNACSARYILLSIGGLPFRVLGTDGGLIEAPATVTEALLTPGDRLDLAVGPFAPGMELAVEASPYFRRTTGPEKGEQFAVLKVGAAAPSTAVIAERLRTIVPIADPSMPVNRTVTFGARTSPGGGVDFLVNNEQHHQDRPVQAGELQIWDVVNETSMDHPFHLHGFFFQVLAVNGEPPPWRSWEDTVNVPAGGTVRIAWLPDERPGSWIYHCHILEHHASGMMGHFDVVC